MRNPYGLSWRNLCGISEKFQSAYRFHADFTEIQCTIPSRILCGIYAETLQTFMDESKLNFCGIPSSVQISSRFHENFKQISQRFNAEYSTESMWNLCAIHADFPRGIYEGFLRNSIQHADFTEIQCRISYRILCGIYAKSMQNLCWL